MASNNIVTRLLLDDKDYSAKLDKAKKSNREFADSTTSGLTAALKGVAAAVAVAVTAMESFKRVINASQTTSDAFEATMRGMRNSVDSFFTALSTGDFTAFSMGLDGIMNKARATAAALDQLGNTVISYGYFSSRNQADFNEAITTMRDRGASADEIAAAKATADKVFGDQEAITQQLKERVKEAIQNLVTEGNLLSSNAVTTLDIDKVLRLDVDAMGAAQKEALKQQYAEYMQIYEDVVKQNSYVTTTSTNYGSVSTKTTDWDKVREQMAAVNEQYQDAILFNEILVRNSDEWLKELVSVAQQSDHASRVLSSMARMLNRAESSTANISRNMQTTAIAARSIPGVNTNLAGIANQPTSAPSAIPTLEGGDITGFGLAVDVAAAQRSLGNKAVQTGLQIIADEQIENINTASTALGGMASVISTLSGAVDDSTASWLTWTAGVLQAVAQALPQIAALTAASGAEATASGTAAVGKSASTAAVGGPVAAAAAAVSVAAAIAAAMASIPKFEFGGVVPGTSYTGDKMLIRVNSGERVLTRDQDAALRGLGGKVKFVIHGQELYGVLDNYLNQMGRRL